LAVERIESQKETLEASKIFILTQRRRGTGETTGTNEKWNSDKLIRTGATRKALLNSIRSEELVRWTTILIIAIELGHRG
jgi:hypothetical protein